MSNDAVYPPIRHNKLRLFFHLVATTFLVGFVCCAGINYHIHRVEDNAMEHLCSLAELKSTESFLWRGITLVPIERIRKNALIGGCMSDFIKYREQSCSYPELVSFMNELQTREFVSLAYLVDTAGQSFMPDTYAQLRVPRSLRPFIQRAVERKTACLTPLSFYQSLGDKIYVVAPYYSKEAPHQHIATLVVGFNFKPLFDSLFKGWGQNIQYNPDLSLIERISDSEMIVYGYNNDHISVKILNIDQFSKIKSITNGISFIGNNVDNEPALNAIYPMNQSGEWFVWISILKSQLATSLQRDISIIILLSVFIYTLMILTVFFLREKWIKKRMSHMLDARQRKLDMSKHYRHFFKSSQEMFFCLSQNRKILDINESACRIFQLNTNALSEYDFENLFSPNDRAKILKALDPAIANEKDAILETKAMNPDGSFFYAELSILRSFIDNICLIHVIVRDITKRKNYENTLIQNSLNLRSTLSAISLGILTLDVDGVITLANESAARLFGCDINDVKGQRFNDIATYYTDANDTLEELTDALHYCVDACDEQSHFELKLVIKNKEAYSFPVIISIVPIFSGGRCVNGYVVAFDDVTSEELSNKQLRHSQKMEAIGLLAGGIAHDFNNMLTGILGGCELLRAHNIDPDSQKYLEMVECAAGRAENLTKRLLSFARKRVPSRTEVNLHQILKNELTKFRKICKKNIQIEVQFYPKDCIVFGDSASLESALDNVLDNAQDAMPEGGRLFIKSSITFIDANRAAEFSYTIDPGSYVRIDIANNGVPIDPDNLWRIFDPFFTTKPVGQGAGLGLSATFNVLRDHQGTVTVTSHEELTTFSFFFPLFELRETVTEAPEFLPQNQLPKAQRPATLMVVDDEPVVRSIATEILSSAGFIVQTAEDGNQAIDLLSRNKDLFQLILLDLVMPNCPGEEAVPKLREICPNIPIIVASGFDRNDQINALLDKYHCSFIGKPYSISDLLQRVTEQLS